MTPRVNHSGRLMLIILILLLAACSPAAVPQPALTTAPAQLNGNVSLVSPEAGSIIYAEVLYLNGTADGLAEDWFRLRLVDTDGRVVAQTPVSAGVGNWRVSLVHGYDGEPVEVTIMAVPVRGEGVYSASTIVLAGLGYRPEGVFGRVTQPEVGDRVGGDVIEIRGRVSGVPGRRLTLRLVAADGTLLDSREIDPANPGLVDDVPWRGQVATRGYTGAAAVETWYSDAVGDEVLLDRVLITIIEEAW
jgi:hypothetical protein